MAYRQLRQLIPFKDWLIWTDVVGAPGKTPLVCIPGGPGMAHDYLAAFAALSGMRPVVFYDPLGAGRSTRKMNAQWTLPLLREEVVTVCRALGLARVHLFGHAAGSLIAVDAALAEPARFASLILSSPPLDVPRYNASVRQLVAGLDAEQARALERGDLDPAARDERYHRAYYAFARQHICRVAPHLHQILARLGKNNAAAHRALKGGLLLYTGALANLSFYDRLRELTMPTLLTTGRHDAVTPAMLEEMRARIPRARARVFAESSQNPHLEETSEYLGAVAEFLDRVDDDAEG